MVHEYAREPTYPKQRRAGLPERRTAAGKDGNAIGSPAGRNGVSDDTAGAADPPPASD